MFLRQKLGWVLIFASSVPKASHCSQWCLPAWLLLPLGEAPGAPSFEHGPDGEKQAQGSQEDFSSHWLVPGGLSGWVLPLALPFGGHLVDSAGFKGNPEQSSGWPPQPQGEQGGGRLHTSAVGWGRKEHPWVGRQVCMEGKEKEKREKEPIISRFPIWLGKAKN